MLAVLWLNIFVLIIWKIVICFTLVRNYGEYCNNTDECGDHRFECVSLNNNIWKCLCDRFHLWQGQEIGCVQIFNASDIINMTVTISDPSSNLDKEVENIFRIQIAAGVFVLIIVIFASLVVVIYCIYITRKDSSLKDILPNYKKRRKLDQPSTSTSPTV